VISSRVSIHAERLRLWRSAPAGKNWLYPLILIGYMVPFEAVIIPLYNLMNSVGITDTLWALILPQVGLSVSFGTMWMASFSK